jgi:hypothetical protein
MNENVALQLRDNAKNQLLKIKDVESGLNYLNKVKAIEVWAKAEKKDAELQTLIAEQKIRTQRILGKLIQDGQANGELANRGGDRDSNVPPGNIRNQNTLSDIGITAKQSMAYKQIASIPDETFEQVIAEKKKAVEDSVAELTTAGMLKVAKEAAYEQKKEQAQKEKWTDEEAELMRKVKSGETVVINMNKHLKVLKYAEDNGIYVRIDRFSDWGNPFIMDEDGTRDEVCDWYGRMYLPKRKQLTKRALNLKGKVLGCHCYPNRCHGDYLVHIADGKVLDFQYGICDVARDIFQREFQAGNLFDKIYEGGCDNEVYSQLLSLLNNYHKKNLDQGSIDPMDNAILSWAMAYMCGEEVEDGN